ncbi:FHA domain-containing protein [bacterium]|nr:FHA domain-containing protein [bacterium]
MPNLVQINKTGSVVKSWELRDDPVQIGRGDDVQIKIDDHEMSRRHCEITGNSGRHSIQDQNSTNGTWVNGRRITSAILKVNDQIKAGETTFLYHIGTSTMLGVAEKAMGKGFHTQLGEIYKDAEK